MSDEKPIAWTTSGQPWRLMKEDFKRGMSFYPATEADLLAAGFVRKPEPGKGLPESAFCQTGGCSVPATVHRCSGCEERHVGRTAFIDWFYTLDMQQRIDVWYECECMTRAEVEQQKAALEAKVKGLEAERWCPECDLAGRLDDRDHLFKTAADKHLAAEECSTCHGEHWPPQPSPAVEKLQGGTLIIDGWECSEDSDGVREASSVEGDDYVEGWPDRICSFKPTTARQYVRIPRAVAVWLLRLEQSAPGGKGRG